MYCSASITHIPPSPRLTHNLHLNCNSRCDSQPNAFFLRISPAQIDWSCFCTRWQSTPGPTSSISPRHGSAVQLEVINDLFSSVFTTVAQLCPSCFHSQHCVIYSMWEHSGVPLMLCCSDRSGWQDTNAGLGLHKTRQLWTCCSHMNNAALLRLLHLDFRWNCAASLGTISVIIKALGCHGQRDCFTTLQ